MSRIRFAVDHAPHDGVGHDLLTPDGFEKYKDAADKLSRFRVPILVHANSRHEKLFFIAFDGVGNKKYAVPPHSTNISKIHDQINGGGCFGHAQVLSHYIDGPGNQSGWFGSTRDSYGGSDYVSNISNAYDALVRQANRWLQDDPDSVIRVHSVGFSRGASQVPGFARLLHERGIPDLQSETMVADGTIAYPHKLVEAGRTAQTMALFDPVATGIPVTFDRRLPASVVSGFQITAADERRAAFQGDRIIPPGFSGDGWFLNVTVPGAHSDVGGGYMRDGLSTRCGNLMRDYCDALRDEPYLLKEYEPTDVRVNVIHRSTEGMSSTRLALEVFSSRWVMLFAVLGAVIGGRFWDDMGVSVLFSMYFGAAVGVAFGAGVGFYRANVRGGSP